MGKRRFAVWMRGALSAGRRGFIEITPGFCTQLPWPKIIATVTPLIEALSNSPAGGQPRPALVTKLVQPTRYGGIKPAALRVKR